MLGRMLPRLPEHLAFGGLDAADLAALRRVLAAAELGLIVRLHSQGEPWSYIGGVLGITRQSAHERWTRAGRPE